MRNHDRYSENFFFLYVVTTAPAFFSFLVFLAFVQHSRIISLSDGCLGGVGEGGALWRSRWDEYRVSSDHLKSIN